ncbi:ISAs1 family transposase [Nostoc sp.]|uniref:ISAs1 family transposase n=1 Tax=Nostoc sp. TaxID=1180 RepID=UPI003FA54E11
MVDYHERHFYLSSLNYSASEFAEVIRGHWSIENQLDWVKDVTLNEDNCIHTGGFSPANWAMVRQFLVSLARQLNYRTLPEALRLMANQLRMIFDALFDHSDSLENLAPLCSSCLSSLTTDSDEAIFHLGNYHSFRDNTPFINLKKNYY